MRNTDEHTSSKTGKVGPLSPSSLLMARHLLKKLPALKAIYYQPCNISYSVFPLSPPARYWRNLSCEAGADGASWLLGLPLKVSFQWPLEQIEKMCVMALAGLDAERRLDSVWTMGGKFVEFCLCKPHERPFPLCRERGFKVGHC